MEKSQSNQAPVIIRENKIEAESFIRELQENYLPAVKSVCVKLKSMRIAKFPVSAITEALSGNYDQISNLYQPIIEAEKNKVQSNELKNSIEANMSTQFSGLIDLVSRSFAGDLRNDPFWGDTCQDIEEIKTIRSRLFIIPKKSKSLFQFIWLDNQMEPVLTDEIEQKIRELFADIATPKQAAIIEAQTQAAKSLTQMSDALIANGQRHDFEIIMSFARKFFSVKKDEKTGRFDIFPNTDTIALL